MLQRWIAGAMTAGLLVSGVVAGTALTASAAGAATPSTCPSGHYPAADAGRPTVAKVGMTGMALWFDKYGWHLRVSEAGPDRAVFTGRIWTDGTIKDVTRRTEGGDLVLNVGAHQVLYRFTNYGAVDGIDFVVPCSSTFRVSVALNGTALPTGHIVIGAGNHHPSTNPVAIAKTP
jgi:hypothetical protein